MADPHIKSPMDAFDIFTVILYRAGLTLAAPAVVMLSFGIEHAKWLLFAAATFSAATLHIYSKWIRFFLQMTTWCGLLIALGTSQLDRHSARSHNWTGT